VNPDFGLVIVGVLDLIIAIALFWVGAKASKIDKLEENIEAKAQELIDAKCRLMTAQVDVSLAKVNTAIEHQERRLERGDEQFDEDTQALRTLELRHSTRFEQERTFNFQNFAARAELQAFEERMRDLELKLTVLGQSVGRRMA
jgi:paraquat-inducible protein B